MRQSRLVEAIGSWVQVTRARPHPDTERLDGRIVAVGPEWVIIETLSDGIYFDGWNVVRSTHITALDPDFPDNPKYLARALAEMPSPPMSGALVRAVGGTGSSALRAILATANLVAIHIEKEDPEMLFVGQFEPSYRRSIAITSVDHQGQSDEDRLNLYTSTEITRVTIGSRYLDGLARFSLRG